MFTSDRGRVGVVTSLVLVAAALSATCAPPFDPNDGAPSGGSSGEAGADAGGFGGMSGGTPREPPGAGTGGSSGTASQGGNGSGAEGGDPTEAGNGGASGSPDGGEGGQPSIDIPEWPREGDRCTQEGYFACPGPRAGYRLWCNGSTWERSNDCGSTQVCNRLTGLCEPTSCEPGSATCLGTLTEQRCGPDGLTLENEDCAFTCRETVGCVEPGDGQVYVDRPLAIQGNATPWPRGVVPVCLRNADRSEPEIIQLVDAFYRTWGRYAAVRLQGFDACDANSKGVALELAEECNVELARISRSGYPGPSVLLPVTLCRSYNDSAGFLRQVEGALFDFAAIHVLGHVLGAGDDYYVPTGGSIMMQAVDLSGYEVLSFVGSSTAIAFIQELYGTVPSGSVGGPSGRCLGFAPQTEAPTFSPCDGAPERTFRFVGGRLEHTSTGTCLRDVGGRARLGDCNGAERWDTTGVHWLSMRAQCVTFQRSPPTGESPLATRTCAPEYSADQRWDIDFPEPSRARIRLAADQRCVRWPGGTARHPELGDCDGMNDRFDTSRGRLEIAGRCLYLSTGTVTFTACHESVANRYELSGPIRGPTGALTVVADGNAPDLSISPLSSPASAAQTFDFSF